MARKSNGKASPSKSRGKSNKPRSSRARRGRSESMTGAADAKVEVRKAGELDLQQVEIDDADFDMHFRAAKTAKETAEKYQSLYRSQLKAAKKVSPALAEAVKWALGSEGKDAADIKREMEIKGYVLKRQGSPIQLTVHDTLLGDTMESYYKRGHADGEAGKTADARAPEGSDLHSEYMRGWQHGTAKNLGLSPEQSDAALAAGVGHNSAAEGAALN